MSNRKLSPKEKAVLELKKRKKRNAMMSFVVLIGVCFISVMLLWFNSPNELAKRAEHKQIKVANSKSISNHPKSKSIKYGGGTGVPDLKTMLKQRQKSNPSLRGYVSMPGINLNTPIFEGTDTNTLSWGAGTAKPNELMGKKNFAIEAHNFSKLSVAKNWYFTNLQNSIPAANDINLNYVRPQEGTEIYTLDKNYVYEYKQIKHRIININNPMSNSVLSDNEVEQSSNKKTPVITLSTCYEQQNIAHPLQRIVITGQLIKKTKVKEFKKFSQTFKNV